MSTEVDIASPQPLRHLKSAAAVVLMVAAGIVSGGVFSRVHAHQELATWTDAQAIPTVATVLPQASPASQPLATLTRGGWNNPTGLQRPGLQRVAYVLDNGTLRREYWNVLDAAQGSTTIKRDLLTHLKSVTLRYMDASHNWQTQWPPTTVGGSFATEISLRQRPIAVEITLETEDWGKIQRVLEIPG